MDTRQNRRPAPPPRGGTFEHRLTRRSLLRGTAGLGAGTLALAAGGPALVGARQWTPLTTADQYSADVALEWFHLAFDISLSTPRFSPGAANRAYAYLGITLYEAVVPAMPGSASLAGRLADLAPVPGPHNRAYHWPTCANAALAQGMRELFQMTTPENMEAIDALEASLEEQLAIGRPRGIGTRSARRGYRVADHILAWARTDGAFDDHPAYVPPVGPGLWVPTPPAFAGPAAPYGGSMRSLAIGPVEDFNPGPPPPFSTDPASEFYAIQHEVYETVNNLTDEQLEIALYWSRTVGHHLSIVIQAVEAQDCDLGTAAETFARAGIALQDAGTACFHTKYTYNLLRPITYIRAHIDPNWGDPLPVTTPPHPDYTAAHAVVASALSQALFDQFGDFAFTDTTWVYVGHPARSYNSWAEMAEETAISRVYGGIHSRPACEVGLEQGRLVGEAVSAVFDG